MRWPIRLDLRLAQASREANSQAKDRKDNTKKTAPKRNQASPMPRVTMPKIAHHNPPHSFHNRLSPCVFVESGVIGSAECADTRRGLGIGSSCANCFSWAVSKGKEYDIKDLTGITGSRSFPCIRASGWLLDGTWRDEAREGFGTSCFDSCSTIAPLIASCWWCFSTCQPGMMLRFCRLQPERLNPVTTRIMSGIRCIEEGEFVDKVRLLFCSNGVEA